MTWWHNTWWIRVDNGPHMRSAKGRRRTWRAARQAAEQVRDGNNVGETWREEKERLKKGDRGGRKAAQKEQRGHLTPNPTRLTPATPATTATPATPATPATTSTPATTAAISSNSSRFNRQAVVQHGTPGSCITLLATCTVVYGGNTYPILLSNACSKKN